MPSVVVRARQEKVELGPFDMAIEHQPHGAVFRLPARAGDVEGAVLEALARARQPQLGRIELEVGEMDDAVVAALEIGGQRREPAREAPEEAVVEAADPGLGGSDDMAALVVRAGHDMEIGNDVDDAKARDQVALHRARQQDVEPAGDEVDQNGELAVPFGAGEPEVIAAHQLRRDRQPAFDLSGWRASPRRRRRCR